MYCTPTALLGRGPQSAGQVSCGEGPSSTVPPPSPLLCPALHRQPCHWPAPCTCRASHRSPRHASLHGPASTGRPWSWANDSPWDGPPRSHGRRGRGSATQGPPGRLQTTCHPGRGSAAPPKSTSSHVTEPFVAMETPVFVLSTFTRALVM